MSGTLGHVASYTASYPTILVKRCNRITFDAMCRIAAASREDLVDAGVCGLQTGARVSLQVDRGASSRWTAPETLHA